MINKVLEKSHKVPRLHEESDIKGNDGTTPGGRTGEEDDDSDDIAAGLELPTDFENVEPDDDDEGGRFFGGGITAETAGALDFIEEQDQTDPVVRISSAYVQLSHADSW